jgi:hypothetical protein
MEFPNKETHTHAMEGDPFALPANQAGYSQVNALNQERPP